MKILVTGAAGAVGSTVVKGLREKYELRGHDRVPAPDLDDAVIGDLTDFDSLLRATEGMDAVMHIGGRPGGASAWEDVLNSNFIGAYNVFEAARQNGVRRIAFASRAGFLGTYPEDVMRTVDMMPRPMDYYSASKVFGENLGWMYSARHDMEFVAVRIGNFTLERDKPDHPHQLSHGDAVRVFERAVIHPGVEYEVVFGVSDSNWHMYDLDHGRKVIEYYPQDYAEVQGKG